MCVLNRTGESIYTQTSQTGHRQIFRVIMCVLNVLARASTLRRPKPATNASGEGRAAAGANRGGGSGGRGGVAACSRVHHGGGRDRVRRRPNRGDGVAEAILESIQDEA